MEFKGKNVLITGGTKGIGQHIAGAFYNHGAKTIVVGTNSKRIDEDMETTKSKTLRRIVQQAIIKGRSQKNMKRDDLARMLNVKVAVVTEYESKSPIPNQHILNKIEKILGVKLQGKDDEIGTPYVRHKIKTNTLVKQNNKSKNRKNRNKKHVAMRGTRQAVH